MQNITPLNAESFATVLTDDERAIVDGRRPAAKRGLRVTARDFSDLAGSRSYKRRRGEWKVFA